MLALFTNTYLNYKNILALQTSSFMFLRVQMSSNNNNQGQIYIKNRSDLHHKKPLMYFCFDLLDQGPASINQNNLQTVAVTCPRKDLSEGTKIQKCCPPHEYLDTYQDKCVRSETNLADQWRLQINGHLYTQEDLSGSGVLENKKSANVSTVELSVLVGRPFYLVFKCYVLL